MVEPGMYIYDECSRDATAMMGPNKYYSPTMLNLYVTGCRETFHQHFIDAGYVLVGPAEVTQW